jgi:hypothetical protein
LTWQFCFVTFAGSAPENGGSDIQKRVLVWRISIKRFEERLCCELNLEFQQAFGIAVR